MSKYVVKYVVLISEINLLHAYTHYLYSVSKQCIDNEYMLYTFIASR